MIDTKIGTVVAVDRTLGTVDAELRSGQMLYGVKYLTTPPWKGLDASFAEVAAGAWLCVGLVGDQGGFGPNLVTNPEMVEDTAGWDNTASTAWNFDGTTESWVALASTTIALETTVLYNGNGSLKVTATAAATVGATSPTGASAVGSIVAGTSYNLGVWVLNDPTKNTRTCQARIKWYTAVGAFISDSAFGATVTTDGAVWRAVGCTATAPATAGRAAIEVQFVSAANGDVFYIDTAVLTGGSGATITRDTTNFYSLGAGSASLAITSSAAGLAYAQTPSPATDPLAGFPVNAGDVYYVDCRFRQPNGLQMFIVAAWVFADGSTVPDFNLDSRSVPGTSSFQYHLQTFIAPTGAVAVHFAFAFLATAGSQVLNIDSIKVRQALLNPGAGLSSVVPDNFSWAIGGKQQQPGMALWVPNENDFPRLVINGYLAARSLHARIKRVGLGNQNIPNAAPTFVACNTITENAGMTVSADGTGAGSWIKVPRTGYYLCEGQLTWATGLTSGATGGRQVEVWRYSSDGATQLELVTSNGVGIATAWFTDTFCTGMVVRVNRDERLYLVARQAVNTTGSNIQDGQTMLSVTYIGDA